MKISGDDVTTDVFIAGCGPAACAYARILAPSGMRVIMADKGPQMSLRPGYCLKNAVVYQRDLDRFTPIVQGLLNTYSLPPRPGHTLTLDPISYKVGAHEASVRSAINPRQDPYKNLPSAAGGFAVGGMLIHWTSSVPRHHPVLERISYISDEEWNDLYGTAESYLTKNTNVFSMSARQTVIKETLYKYYGSRISSKYTVQEIPMAAQRRQDNEEFVDYAGSDTILGPLADDPHSHGDKFKILSEHRVRQLVQLNNRVEYAIVDDILHNRTFRVYADVFVVAGGAVGTPQLLWNSGIRPYALGRFLSEHTFTFTQIVLKKDIVDSIARDPRFADEIARNDPLDPIPIPIRDPAPNLMIPVSEGRPWHCQIHRDSFAFGGLPPDVDPRLIVDLRWFGMVEPVADNRVKFEEDIFDKFGLPQPTFEYVLGDADRQRAHNMMMDMVECANELGGFLVGSEPKFMPPGASLHLMGTTRMGQHDDDNSVVDPYSRVWGLDNLYLGGNNVIPTKNASNPTLTTVALAIRSARKIRGDINATS